MPFNASDLLALGASGMLSCADQCLPPEPQFSNLIRLCGDVNSTMSCIQSGCGIQRATLARIAVESACGTPVRNRRNKFIVMEFTLGAVTIGFVAARLLFNRFFSRQKRLGMQDWAIAASTLLGLVCMGLVLAMLLRGLGMDVWGVPPDHVREFSLLFYVLTVLYIILISGVKISLCLFYLVLFTNPIPQRLVWGAIAFHVAFGIAFTIVLVFQCNPISDPWSRYDSLGSKGGNDYKVGRCINVNATGWASAAINLASDVWLLAIPVFQIRKLKLHWKKKVGAILMFEVGACVTVISVLRLKSFHGYLNTTNPTWDEWDLIWWSTIEVMVALICICLPVIRLALIQIAPRIFDSSFHHNSRRQNGIASTADQEVLCSGHSQRLTHSPSNDDVIIGVERMEIRTKPLDGPTRSQAQNLDLSAPGR